MSLSATSHLHLDGCHSLRYAQLVWHSRSLPDQPQGVPLLLRLVTCLVAPPLGHHGPIIVLVALGHPWHPCPSGPSRDSLLHNVQSFHNASSRVVNRRMSDDLHHTAGTRVSTIRLCLLIVHRLGLLCPFRAWSGLGLVVLLLRELLGHRILWHPCLCPCLSHLRRLLVLDWPRLVEG